MKNVFIYRKAWIEPSEDHRPSAILTSKWPSSKISVVFFEVSLFLLLYYTTCLYIKKGSSEYKINRSNKQATNEFRVTRLTSRLYFIFLEFLEIVQDF